MPTAFFQKEAQPDSSRMNRAMEKRLAVLPKARNDGLRNKIRVSRLRSRANRFGVVVGSPGPGGDPLSRLCLHPASE
jgi:hypothetical protein